jgi:hypothetical protein
VFQRRRMRRRVTPALPEASQTCTATMAASEELSLLSGLLTIATGSKSSAPNPANRFPRAEPDSSKHHQSRDSTASHNILRVTQTRPPAGMALVGSLVASAIAVENGESPAHEDRCAHPRACHVHAPGTASGSPCVVYCSPRHRHRTRTRTVLCCTRLSYGRYVPRPIPRTQHPPASSSLVPGTGDANAPCRGLPVSGHGSGCFLSRQEEECAVVQGQRRGSVPVTDSKHVLGLLRDANRTAFRAPRLDSPRFARTSSRLAGWA